MRLRDSSVLPFDLGFSVAKYDPSRCELSRLSLRYGTTRFESAQQQSDISLRRLLVMKYINIKEVEAALAKEFDVGLLDEVLIAVYDPVSPNRSDANKLLMQLQEAPDFWRRADEIVEKSSNPQTRFFGLQVLHDAVRIR